MRGVITLYGLKPIVPFTTWALHLCSARLVSDMSQISGSASAETNLAPVSLLAPSASVSPSNLDMWQVTWPSRAPTSRTFAPGRTHLVWANREPASNLQLNVWPALVLKEQSSFANATQSRAAGANVDCVGLSQNGYGGVQTTNQHYKLHPFLGSPV